MQPSDVPSVAMQDAESPCCVLYSPDSAFRSPGFPSATAVTDSPPLARLEPGGNLLSSPALYSGNRNDPLSWVAVHTQLAPACKLVSRSGTRVFSRDRTRGVADYANPL